MIPYNVIATSGATGLSDLLTDLGTIFTQMTSWVTTVASTIVSTPVLLLTFGIFVFGAAVGLFGRLLSKG